MIAQVPTTAQPTYDERGSGRLDPLLYGSSDPAKNIATRDRSRIEHVTPKEMFDCGFRHAMDGYKSPTLSASAHYLLGQGAFLQSQLEG